MVRSHANTLASDDRARKGLSKILLAFLKLLFLPHSALAYIELRSRAAASLQMFETHSLLGQQAHNLLPIIMMIIIMTACIEKAK